MGIRETVFMRVISSVGALVMILIGIWLWHEAKD